VTPPEVLERDMDVGMDLQGKKSILEQVEGENRETE